MKDKQIEELIQKEKERQQNSIQLIASENIVSDDVLFEGAFINGKKHGQGYIINKNDKTITPVKFNQGNIESEDAIIKFCLFVYNLDDRSRRDLY